MTNETKKKREFETKTDTKLKINQTENILQFISRSSISL